MDEQQLFYGSYVREENCIHGCASTIFPDCQGNELHVLNNNPTITGFISASASSLQTCTDEEGWVSNIGFTCRDYAILSICVNFGLIEYVDWGSFTDPDSNADGNADFMHRDSNGVPVTHACCSCRLHYDLEASQFNVSSPQFDEQTIANSTAVYYARASSASSWELDAMLHGCGPSPSTHCLQLTLNR